MSNVLFKRALTTAFQPTRAFLIEANRVTFRFELAVTGGTPAVVQYYMEFGSDPDPAGAWYREMAEEDQGAGDVEQPLVLRTLQDVAGVAFVAGTYRMSAQFRREEQLVRLQIKAQAGAVRATIEAPFGQLV